ncbi:DUF4153 domain-containing protein [Alkalibaculum sp. M08DMB]|uniref:DUF4153 domain-containing protein n=1 Tax=Alkalibaculum sporogenes TaxID=2655001 RepID=A0A6A7K4T5_9FIRM|nr:DUF4153 domain-containing protein [Alkalibaculum sporogenes]MPW24476.1 DUF4153 domain-containing protein [Alkalibaculum sporogenes]
MNIISKMKSTLLNLQKSIYRFPLTIGLSGFLLLLLIILNESMSNMNDKQIEIFSKFNMTIGLSVLLSICIGLFIERFYITSLIKRIILYTTGIIALVIYYYNFLPSLDFVYLQKYISLTIILIIGFFTIPGLKSKISFEMYVIKVFSCILITWIYSLVLYLGLIAILFTTNTLFDLNVDAKFYYYIFLIVSLVFAVPLLLSKIPMKDDNLEDYPYSKSLRVLLLYIVVPLITAYTLILYAYFAKILFTAEWPKGLVSHLVLWYSTISVGIIFLIRPIIKDNLIGKLFVVWFPKIVIPILGMMFVSIGLRINQYGITENRYFVVLLGLWVTCIMIYYSLIKRSKNIIIPITLAFTIFIAVFGPLSGSSLSIKSQNNRFNDILTANNMILEGALVSNQELPNEDKKELSNIIFYFETTHYLNDLEVLPDDFKTSDMVSLLGFAYAPQYEDYQEYFYNGLDIYNTPILISDYDYFIKISTWNNQRIDIDNLNIHYDIKSHDIIVKEGDFTLLDTNIIEKGKEIYLSGEMSSGKEMFNDIESMSFEEENANIKAKFIFANISGRINTDNISLEDVEFILLIQLK